MKWKSIIMVIVQMSAIAYFFISDRPVCYNPVLIGIQVAGLLLLVWTWFNLIPGKFHVMPDTIKNAKLVTSGPFRLIRHPMYLSLFLYLVPLLINYFSWLRLAVIIVFCINMVVKLLYEEWLLKAKFPEYEAYMKRTYHLIPFIF